MNGNYGVHAAGLQYFLHRLVGAEDHHFSAAAFYRSRRGHQGAQPHRSEERHFLHVHDHELFRARDHIHAHIDSGRTLNIEATIQDDFRDSAFELLGGDRQFLAPYPRRAVIVPPANQSADALARILPQIARDWLDDTPPNITAALQRPPTTGSAGCGPQFFPAAACRQSDNIGQVGFPPEVKI